METSLSSVWWSAAVCFNVKLIQAGLQTVPNRHTHHIFEAVHLKHSYSKKRSTIDPVSSTSGNVYNMKHALYVTLHGIRPLVKAK